MRCRTLRSKLFDISGGVEKALISLPGSPGIRPRRSSPSEPCGTYSEGSRHTPNSPSFRTSQQDDHAFILIVIEPERQAQGQLVERTEHSCCPIGAIGNEMDSSATGRGGYLRPEPFCCPCCWVFSILAQVSRKVAVRLKTRAPGAESPVSTQK
jgi:hypothetical protein